MQSSISKFFRQQPKSGSPDVPPPARKRRKLHGNATAASETEAGSAAQAQARSASEVEAQAQTEVVEVIEAEAETAAAAPCARASVAGLSRSPPVRAARSVPLQLPPIELDGERADAARAALRNCLVASDARDGVSAVADAASTDNSADRGSNSRANVAKAPAYTPLERQVLELRKAASGAILLVECGYRFRFFGNDARVAASVLSIYAHRDHNFDVASVPVHRVAVHLRRLLQAGHRVAVARQCEYASLRKEARAKERQEAAGSDGKGRVKSKGRGKATGAKGSVRSSKTFDRELVALYTHASPLPATDAELLDELGIDSGKRAGEAGGAGPGSTWRSRGWNWKRSAASNGEGGGREDSTGGTDTDADADVVASNIASSHTGDSTGHVVAALFGFPNISAVGVVAVDVGSVPGVLAIDVVGCDREKAASANEGEHDQGKHNSEGSDVGGQGCWWTPASIAIALRRAAEEDGLFGTMMAGAAAKAKAGTVARGAAAAWLRWRRALHTSKGAAAREPVPVSVQVSMEAVSTAVPKESVVAASASADAACATGVITRLRQLQPTELLLSSDDSSLPPATMGAVRRWLENGGGESCRVERVAFSTLQPPSSMARQDAMGQHAQPPPVEDLGGERTWASQTLDALRMLLRAADLSRGGANSTASMLVSRGIADVGDVATSSLDETPDSSSPGQQLHHLPPPCHGALALLLHHLQCYRLENVLQPAPALATANLDCGATDISGGLKLGVPIVWLRVATGAHDRFMHLDGDTLHDLSVLRAPAGAAGKSDIRNMSMGGRGDGSDAWGSLLWLLSRGLRTRAGGRLLRRWLAHPLAQCVAIEARLDAVAALAKADNHGLFDGAAHGAGSSLPSATDSVDAGVDTELNNNCDGGSEDSGDAAGCGSDGDRWQGHSRRLLLSFQPLVALLRRRGAKQRLPDLALCVTRLRLGRGAPQEVVRMLRALHSVASAAITARAAAQCICAAASVTPRSAGPPPPSQLLALALSAGDAGERVRGACDGLLSLLGLDGSSSHGESAGSVTLPPRTELFHEAERAAQEADSTVEADAQDSRGDDSHAHFAMLLGRDLLHVRQRIAAARASLDTALTEARSVLQKPSLKYRTLRTGPTSQLEHLLELRRTEPAVRRVPEDWLQVSATKEYLRYHTPAALSAAHELECARERLVIAADTAWKLFCKHAVTMLDGVSGTSKDGNVDSGAGTHADADAGAGADADAGAVDGSDGHSKAQNTAATTLVAPLDTLLSCFARLDALLALAATARMPGYCRPSYLRKPSAGDGSGESAPDSPVLARPHAAMLVRGARHPLLERVLDHGAGAGNAADGAAAACGSFVPNDVALAWGGASFAEACRAARAASQWHEGSPLLSPGQPQTARALEQEICAPQSILLTGPNAGGKSCYARTVATLAIMGQCGAFIPATRAEMPPFDCVCTRMGASDDLAAGRSTFLVELERASAILARATSRSLVVLDELGRGTSTHDGVAIAYATLRYLAGATGSTAGCTAATSGGSGSKTKSQDNAVPSAGRALRAAQLEAERPAKGPRCCSIFVTHYHALSVVADELPGEVISAHMSYLENTPTTAPTSHDPALVPVPTSVGVPSVTFLYQLANGTAPASFGLNIARAAGLPPQVLQSAAERAAAMRRQSKAGLNGSTSCT